MDFVFCAASQFDSAAMDYLKASQSCSPPCSPFDVNPEGKYICKIAILIHTHTHTLSVSLSLSHTHIHTHTRWCKYVEYLICSSFIFTNLLIVEDKFLPQQTVLIISILAFKENWPIFRNLNDEVLQEICKVYLIKIMKKNSVKKSRIFSFFCLLLYHGYLGIGYNFGKRNEKIFKDTFDHFWCKDFFEAGCVINKMLLLHETPTTCKWKLVKNCLQSLDVIDKPLIRINQVYSWR